MSGDGPVVVCEGLVKRYGRVAALDGFDLEVPAGRVHGLLGPNGAGKTTAVRILTTLLRADSGRARVAGWDVARRPDEVRSRIGLVGQSAAVDEILSGRQNLVMFARLYHLGVRAARARAEDLLEQFGLAEAGAKPVAKYSGGMRRRLDLAPASSSPRKCSSSTSPPRAWTRTTATRSGKPSARWCGMEQPWCSPPSTWRRLTSSPRASR